MAFPSLSQLVLASNNPHKHRELKMMLAPLGVDVILLPNPPDVEETGDTFEKNAVLKALEFATISGLPSLADDSGLVVDALDGAPGVYSARFAGEDACDSDNNALLLKKLSGLPRSERKAHFYCAIALVWPPGTDSNLASEATLSPGVTHIPLQASQHCGFLISGKTHGEILESPRGGEGFGYDPLFLSEDLNITFAEANAQQKSSVSHRGRAIARLKEFLAEHQA